MRRPIFRNSRNRRSRSRSKCFRCQKPGHYIRDCKELAIQQTQPENRARRTEGVRRITTQREIADLGQTDTVKHRIDKGGTARGRESPTQLSLVKQLVNEKEKESVKIARIRLDVQDRWTNDQLKEEQSRDKSIAPIVKWMERGRRPEWQEISTETMTVKSYWAQWQSLTLKNGLLMRLWESADGSRITQQIVLPASRISEVLQEMHDGRSGAHLGVNKTLDKIRNRFYWVNYRRDVEEWCRKCEKCSTSKGPQTRTRGKMQQYNVGVPFERIAMDIAGPFPVTKDGNRYILVCIDYFSKWVEAYPVRNQEARTVAEAFVNNWVCRFGVPLELHSDQGRNFESSVIQELCEILNIKKTRTTPLHPQSDGMVERFNRTLEQHLRSVVNANQDNWDVSIPLFLMGYRSAVHDTTGNSPAMVIFGRERAI